MEEEEKPITKKGLLGQIKLKHVWVLSLVSIAYIIGRQGWPSPAIDDLIVKATAVWIGALIGFGVDSVHFWLWKPDSKDPDHENFRRRAWFIGIGMLAMAVSV